MPLSDAQKAALNRLQSFYEGDNPYNSVTNPGGFRQNGHLYNFVPALKDVATVITGVAALAVEVATNSAQSPKAVRVDAAQSYTDDEKAQGQANLGIAATIAAAVRKTGDTMTGVLKFVMGDAAIELTQNGGTYDKQTWRLMHYNQDGKLYFQDYRNGTYVGNPVYFGRDGAIITAQFGDLNARIEARASVFAAQRLALTGGTLTGALTLAYASPYLTLQGDTGVHVQLDQRKNGGEQWNMHSSTNRNFYIYRPSPSEGGAADYAFVMTPGGAISTQQFGDLNSRIETRAKAFADAAQAVANQKVAKAGDTMTGSILMNGDLGGYTPGIKFNMSGTDWFLRGIGGNRVQFCDQGMTVEYVSFGADGTISTRQLGDLNSRIETRGQAWSNAAFNRCFSQGRYVFVGDYDITGNFNGGMVEPFAPSVCTGRSSITSGDGNDIILRAMRFRRPQFYLPNAGWVDVGYA